MNLPSEMAPTIAVPGNVYKFQIREQFSHY